MKKKFLKHSLILNSMISIIITIIVNGSALKAQSFKIFAVSDLVRVFEDGYNLPPTSDTIKIFGIRGEIISGQCAVSAKNNLTNLSVELSAFKNQVTGNSLPSKYIEWNFVGSIPLVTNTPNQPLTAVVRKAPAKFPDYLMAEKQMNINNGAYQSIWLTINIPETAEAGTYTGKVTVKSVQGEQSLPVFLTVYPLTLPAERHLNIVEWYGTGGFSKWHGIQEKYSNEWFAMLRKYADNMVAHRQNSFKVTMDVIDIQKSKSGQLEFDFSQFDQIAQVFWNTGKMDYMETGFLAMRGEKGWNDSNFRWKDITVKNSETGEQVTMTGKEVIPSLVSAFESHLRNKGWLNKTWFHIQDEPALHNALSWHEFSSFIHQYAPDLIRMDAIETESAYVLDEIEIAVPKVDAFASWYDTYKKAQQEGVKLWFYTVGTIQGSLLPSKTIDMPLMKSRIMHWYNYKYDATGYLHWGWNSWTENPYQAVGQHIGDGWHVYPVKDGVLNSLRWEQMRNGIQDYEYCWMLENKISALKDSLGSRFRWIVPNQKGKEISGQVIMGFAEQTNDPNVLYKAKMEVIRELLDFNASPRIYVQTNPVVNSALTDQSSVGVYGWTEPGTKIVVNGRELPVSSQGLFLEQFKLSTKNNIIRVQASNARGSKEIVRTFVIK